MPLRLAVLQPRDASTGTAATACAAAAGVTIAVGMSRWHLQMASTAEAAYRGCLTRPSETLPRPCCARSASSIRSAGCRLPSRLQRRWCGRAVAVENGSRAVKSTCCPA